MGVIRRLVGGVVVGCWLVVSAWGEESFRLNGAAPSANCPDCHGWRQPVEQPRLLKKPHQGLVRAHGRAGLWCLDCHDPGDPATLVPGRGREVAFDQAYRLCETCHAREVREWRLGVHGRRVGSWRGGRVIERCVKCHDAHEPAVKPLVPAPPPPASR